MKWFFNLFRRTPAKPLTFDQWFTTKKFKHFSADEFTSYFNVQRYRTTNSPPPRDLWENIVPTLRLVEEARIAKGRSIVLLSSYRNKIYNHNCGGVDSSEHRKFRALDIAMAGVSPRDLFDYFFDLRQQGLWVGGLGLYDTFVHIDTRSTNATWDKT